MADRYKEGYNDCNIEWEKKIEDKINKLEEESKPLYEKEFISVDEDWILHNNKRKIEILQNLLKKVKD